MYKSKLIVKTKVDEDKGIALRKVQVRGRAQDAIIATLEAIVEMHIENGFSEKEFVNLMKETYKIVKEGMEDGE